MLAQLRAIECRRYFVRCAATGQTCVISPVGQIESQLPLQTQGVLTAHLALVDGRSVYCRIGDVFPVACGAWLALWACGPWYRARWDAQAATSEA
jgi:apolipoprotein N-acyltransferase